MNGAQYYDQLLTANEKASYLDFNDFKLTPFNRVNFGNGTSGSDGSDPGKGPANGSYLPPNDLNNSGSIEESNQQPISGGLPNSNPDDNDDDPAAKNSYTLRAFNSTPMFIESLTDLSIQVLSAEGDKKQALKEGLRQINRNLPSNVYIPFVNNAWRNYAVLNICEEESKLFFTKSRAPFLICLEIYRPEEILVTA